MFPGQLILSREASSAGGEVDNHVWFYEGRNGWWQYDERTNLILEDAYARQAANISVLIAGAVYTVDFANECQFKQNAQSRKRKIKRALAKDIQSCKGIAGIPTSSSDDHLPEIAR